MNKMHITCSSSVVLCDVRRVSVWFLPHQLMPFHFHSNDEITYRFYTISNHEILTRFGRAHIRPTLNTSALCRWPRILEHNLVLILSLRVSSSFLSKRQAALNRQMAAIFQNRTRNAWKKSKRTSFHTQNMRKNGARKQNNTHSFCAAAAAAAAAARILMYARHKHKPALNRNKKRFRWKRWNDNSKTRIKN